jgi:hypothetical protein
MTLSDRRTGYHGENFVVFVIFVVKNQEVGKLIGGERRDVGPLLTGRDQRGT